MLGKRLFARMNNALREKERYHLLLYKVTLLQQKKEIKPVH